MQGSRHSLDDACPVPHNRAPADMATAQREDESHSSETIIGRGALPFFLAAIAGAQDVINQQQYKCYSNMCSGNTLNLMMKFASGDWFPDVPFLIGMISHFCASKDDHTRRLAAPRVSSQRHCPFHDRSSAALQVLGMRSSRLLTIRWISAALRR